MKQIFTLLLILSRFCAFGQDDNVKTDWANLSKYALANQAIRTGPGQDNRVVFMGN
jgi:hypothetical protein